MRPLLLSCFLLFLSAAQSQTLYIANWPLPDTARAVSFYSEVKLHSHVAAVKNGYAGISIEGVNLTVEKNKKKKTEIVMTTDAGNVIASGLNVKQVKKKGMTFPVSGLDTGVYKLLLTKAYDSVQNFSIVSGYAYIPQINKWKFIATVKKSGFGFLKEVATLHSVGRFRILDTFMNQAWVRSNNTARTLESKPVTLSAVYWRDEPDSAVRAVVEKALIETAMRNKTLAPMQSFQNVYYSITTQGSGRPLKVTDTLTVFYRGNVLGDTAVFDQTKAGSPARFPLNNLIPGWKIGLPLINEGGKITLVIPSGLAYSIRTRSPKIPPNSILVFEIEVVKAEPGK